MMITYEKRTEITISIDDTYDSKIVKDAIIMKIKEFGNKIYEDKNGDFIIRISKKYLITNNKIGVDYNKSTPEEHVRLAREASLKERERRERE